MGYEPQLWAVETSALTPWEATAQSRGKPTQGCMKGSWQSRSGNPGVLPWSHPSELPVGAGSWDLQAGLCLAPWLGKEPAVLQQFVEEASPLAPNICSWSFYGALCKCWVVMFWPGSPLLIQPSKWTWKSLAETTHGFGWLSQWAKCAGNESHFRRFLFSVTQGLGCGAKGQTTLHPCCCCCLQGTRTFSWRLCQACFEAL